MTETPPPDMVTAQVEDVALVGRRREQIVAAATKLFSRQGYYKTTVKEIAQEADVSPGLIYQYVRDKDDILLLVLLDCVSGYTREIPPAVASETHPLAKLRAAFAAYCRVVDRNRAGAVLAYRSTKSLDAARRRLVMDQELRTNALLAECIARCIDGGFLRAVNVDLVTYQLVMAAHAWALKAWYLGSRFTVEQYIAQSFDIFSGGLLTARGQRAMARLSPAEPATPAA